MKTPLNLAILTAAVSLVGCATHIQPSKFSNPPPAERFSSFDRFELKRVQLSPTYAGDGANQRAAAKIQQYFDERLQPTVTGWNRDGKGGERTLLIEPRIEQIKFIGVGARIWAGPLAGSSAVVMKVKYTDKSTGKVIAEPEFFQRAAAMSGAFTVGGQDNAMLARIVTLAANYNANNFSQPVGGETGATPDTELEAN
ncbi:MAG: hypothetical protein ACM31P_11155 [Actinomycetota bacterium]